MKTQTVSPLNPTSSEESKALTDQCGAVMPSQFASVSALTPTRVQDLQDQTGMAFPRPCLRCRKCGETFSANRGDYFLSRPERVFSHCGRPMQLGIVRTVFEVSA